MLDGKKYEGFGFGRSSDVKSVYKYYETFLGMLDLELCNNIMGDKSNGNDCRSLLDPYFASFQEWCRDIYEEMKTDRDKTYFLFRDILIRYEILKKDTFYEKKDSVFHVLLTKPNDKEGNRGQKMSFVIYEYLNLAINCLEDYVDKLEIKPIKTGPRTRIYGFYIKRIECLNDAFSQLIEKTIISDKTKKKDFIQVFTGGNPDNKIVWHAGPGLLRYFIKEIDGKGIRSTGKNIWDATINCFQDKDGTEFKKEQFRHGKVPKELNDINRIIDTINEDLNSDE